MITPAKWNHRLSSPEKGNLFPIINGLLVVMEKAGFVPPSKGLLKPRECQLLLSSPTSFPIKAPGYITVNRLLPDPYSDDVRKFFISTLA